MLGTKGIKQNKYLNVCSLSQHQTDYWIESWRFIRQVSEMNSNCTMINDWINSNELMWSSSYYQQFSLRNLDADFFMFTFILHWCRLKLHMALISDF